MQANTQNNGVVMVESILAHAHRTYPSVDRAIRRDTVGFIRTTNKQHADSICKDLNENKHVKVVQKGLVVQFWPVELRVKEFEVRQLATDTEAESVIGTVWAEDGSQARDLLAADGGFVARAPGSRTILRGSRTLTIETGEVLMDAKDAYFRSCSAAIKTSLQEDLNNSRMKAHRWRCDVVSDSP